MRELFFVSPTRVILGENAILNLTRELAGISRVLVVYGQRSAKENGILTQVRDQLYHAGIQWWELGGIKPNPLLETALRGVELAQKTQAELVLGVGGGSVIDTAKAIALGAVNDCALWELYNFQAFPEACLPIGVVLTVAGSGSEVSDCSVLTKMTEARKKFCDTELQRPRFAIMDPALCCRVSRFQTACGSTDTLMHILERFCSMETSQVTDELSIALMRSVIDNTDRALEVPDDRNARAELLWAGGLAQGGLVAAGASGGDWAVHAIANELSGVYDVAHAAGLSVVWRHWAEYAKRRIPHRMALFAKRVLDAHGMTEDAMAADGIARFCALLNRWGMPLSLSVMGISLLETESHALALRAAGNKNGYVGKTTKLCFSEVEHIYQLA